MVGVVCSWVFFPAGSGDGEHPLVQPDAPMHGESHDQQETIQAIRGAQLGGFQVKNPRF